MGYDLHDTLPFSAKLYDSSGALTNATSVSLTITMPDQTTVSPSITNPPAVAGTYHYDYPATGGVTQPGRYVGVWLFTMATGATTSYPEVFDVAPADPGFVVSLKQVKDQLNITSTENDDELALHIATATRVVEYFVGPVIVRSYTERVSGRTPAVTHLPRLGAGLTPVLSITSLTPLYTTGISWDLTNVVVDPLTGTLRQATGIPIYGGPWTAVYTAGQRLVDSNWQLAALIEVEHLWRTQRGASGLPLSPQDDAFIPGLGFAIPNRVADLLKLDSLFGIA